MPYEDRVHVGSWTAPSVDLDLNLVFVGTSVTSPAPKFLRGASRTRTCPDFVIFEFETVQVIEMR